MWKENIANVLFLPVNILFALRGWILDCILSKLVVKVLPI